MAITADTRIVNTMRLFIDFLLRWNRVLRARLQCKGLERGWLTDLARPETPFDCSFQRNRDLAPSKRTAAVSVIFLTRLCDVDRDLRWIFLCLDRRCQCNAIDYNRMSERA